MSTPEESAARQGWKAGSSVMIYSNSRKTWYKGEVQSIFHDDEGEWLEVRYDRSMSKQDDQISKASKKVKKGGSGSSSASSASESVLSNFDDEEIEGLTHVNMDDVEATRETRSQWGKDDFLEIFSNTHQEWYLGQVVDIVKDEEGEWLNCVWHRKNGEAMSKQVQRYSTDVRPPQGKNAEKVAGKGSKRSGRTWKQLQEEIKSRMTKFQRECPYFSRTLRSSTWSRPATTVYRRSKRLTDIVESVNERDSSAGSPHDFDASFHLDDGITRFLRGRNSADGGEAGSESNSLLSDGSMTSGDSSSKSGTMDGASDEEVRAMVEKWKGKEVGEWVSRFGEAYKKYVRRISKYSGSDMLNLSDEELTRLGWSKLHRAKFFVELNLKLDGRFRRQVDDVDVLNWSVSQTKQWLYQKHNLNLYSNKFVSHGINGLLLFELDTDDLQTIGIRDIHKQKCLEAIAAFRDQTIGDDESAMDEKYGDDDETFESNDLLSARESDDMIGSNKRNKKSRHNRRESVSLSTGALSMACQTEVFSILEDMSHILSLLAEQSSASVIASAVESSPDVIHLTQRLSQRIEASKKSFCSEIESSMEVDSDEMSTLTDSIAQLGLKSTTPVGDVSAKDPMIEKFSGTEVAGLDIAKEWFHTLEQKKGHKRRQSVTHSDMEASLAAFADGALDDSDEDDVSDIEREQRLMAAANPKPSDDGAAASKLTFGMTVDLNTIYNGARKCRSSGSEIGAVIPVGRMSVTKRAYLNLFWSIKASVSNARSTDVEGNERVLTSLNVTLLSTDWGGSTTAESAQGYRPVSFQWSLSLVSKKTGEVVVSSAKEFCQGSIPESKAAFDKLKASMPSSGGSVDFELLSAKDGTRSATATVSDKPVISVPLLSFSNGIDITDEVFELISEYRSTEESVRDFNLNINISDMRTQSIDEPSLPKFTQFSSTLSSDVAGSPTDSEIIAEALTAMDGDTPVSDMDGDIAELIPEQSEEDVTMGEIGPLRTLELSITDLEFDPDEHFVGLVNEGATCYMNSMLQTFFHLTFLRRQIYQIAIPYEGTSTSSVLTVTAPVIAADPESKEEEKEKVSDDDHPAHSQKTITDPSESKTDIPSSSDIGDAVPPSTEVDDVGGSGSASDLAKPEEDICLQLQRLFYLMQTAAFNKTLRYKSFKAEGQIPYGFHSEGAPSTKKLIHSFGWTDADAFEQHDVQEFCRVLLDVLEHKFRGTKIEGVIDYLFRGEWESYVECINVDYASVRTEPFQDIQLLVKGGSRWVDSHKHEPMNVYRSLGEFVDCETLTGDNRYYANEELGKQDAKKGIRITKLPPILFLQLKRFEFDFYTERQQKINDKFRFHSALDMNQYVYLSREKGGEILSDNWNKIYPHYPKSGPWNYTLKAVLVHSGSTYAGHYYAFIECNGKFHKFDDETVTPVPNEEAIEGTWGGREAHGHRNAYMLVYILNSRMPRLNAPIHMTEEDVSSALPARSSVSEPMERPTTPTIPPRLREYFEEEKQQLDAIRLKQEDELRKMDVCVCNGHKLMDKYLRPYYIQRLANVHRWGLDLGFGDWSEKKRPYKTDSIAQFVEDVGSSIMRSVCPHPSFTDDVKSESLSSSMISTDDDDFSNLKVPLKDLLVYVMNKRRTHAVIRPNRELLSNYKKQTTLGTDKIDLDVFPNGELDIPVESFALPRSVTDSISKRTPNLLFLDCKRVPYVRHNNLDNNDIFGKEQPLNCLSHGLGTLHISRPMRQARAKNSALVCVKYFDVFSQTVEIIGWMLIDRTATLRDFVVEYLFHYLFYFVRIIAEHTGIKESYEMFGGDYSSSSMKKSKLPKEVATAMYHLENSKRIVQMIWPLLQCLNFMLKEHSDCLKEAPNLSERQTDFLLLFLSEYLWIFEEQSAVRVVDQNAPNQTLLDQSSNFQATVQDLRRGVKTTLCSTPCLTCDDEDDSADGDDDDDDDGSGKDSGDRAVIADSGDGSAEMNSDSAMKKRKLRLSAERLDRPLSDLMDISNGDILVFQFSEKVYRNFIVSDLKGNTLTGKHIVKNKLGRSKKIELAKYLYTQYKDRGDVFNFDFKQFAINRFAQVPVRFIPNKPYNINKYLRGRYEIEKRVREQAIDEMCVSLGFHTSVGLHRHDINNNRPMMMQQSDEEEEKGRSDGESKMGAGRRVTLTEADLETAKLNRLTVEAQFQAMEPIESYVTDRMRFDAYMSIDSTITQLKQRVAWKLGVDMGMIWMYTPSVNYNKEWVHVMPSISNHEKTIDQYHNYSNVAECMPPFGLEFKFDMELFPELKVALCYRDDTRVIHSDKKNWDPKLKKRIIEADPDHRSFYPSFYFFSGDGTPIFTNSIRFRFFIETNAVAVRDMLPAVVEQGLCSAMYYLKCQEVYNHKLDVIINEPMVAESDLCSMRSVERSIIEQMRGSGRGSVSAMGAPSSDLTGLPMDETPVMTFFAHFYATVVMAHKEFATLFDLVKLFGAENCFSVQYPWDHYKKKVYHRRGGLETLPFGMFQDTMNGVVDIINGNDVNIRVKFPHQVLTEQYQSMVKDLSWLSDYEKSMIRRMKDDYITVYVRFRYKDFSGVSVIWMNNCGMTLTIGRFEQFGSVILSRIGKFMNKELTQLKKWQWYYSTVYEEAPAYIGEVGGTHPPLLLAEEFDLPFYAFTNPESGDDGTGKESAMVDESTAESTETGGDAASKETEQQSDAADSGPTTDEAAMQPSPERMPFGLTSDRHSKYYAKYSVGGCIVCQVAHKDMFTETDFQQVGRELKIRKYT